MSDTDSREEKQDEVEAHRLEYATDPGKGDEDEGDVEAHLLPENQLVENQVVEN